MNVRTLQEGGATRRPLSLKRLLPLLFAIAALCAAPDRRTFTGTIADSICTGKAGHSGAWPSAGRPCGVPAAPCRLKAGRRPTRRLSTESEEPDYEHTQYEEPELNRPIPPQSDSTQTSPRSPVDCYRFSFRLVRPVRPTVVSHKVEGLFGRGYSFAARRSSAFQRAAGRLV